MTSALVSTVTGLARAMQILGLSLLAGAAPVSAQTASPVPGEEHCVVNVAADDVLNLREGRGTSARVLTGKRYGSCGIIVTDPCQGSWCRVDDGHYQG
ncbi:hypothetical protein GTW51_20215 [Aurantimonas aggregata]|uniref:SH3 domain-containing protein n=1 Tax=Aurantimonas aggregata TaxID=2047720 RepID=A0A6L9MN51_9HYPH|nr:hypothetical protein [Aurantimonas aggregata]NDV89006.1 hypothetical protein [Aurantimonas aggregata]